MGLPRKVLAALVLEDIETPTPVQEVVIPDAMAGHDVLGRARTGSGKTLAFGIPIVARLAGEVSRPKHPRALVIVPTRELAGQVERSLGLVARAMKLSLTTVYGGTPYDRQIQAAAPGRRHRRRHPGTAARPDQQGRAAAPTTSSSPSSTRPTTCATWASTPRSTSCSG